MVTVRDRGGVGSLADHFDLAVEWANEGSDDDRDIRILDVFFEAYFDIACQLRWRLASRHNVLDQRYRYPAIGTHRHATLAEIGITVDEYAKIVAGADHVLIVRGSASCFGVIWGRRGGGWHDGRRIAGRTARDGESRQQRSDD